MPMSHGTEELLKLVLCEFLTHKTVIDDKMLVVSHETLGQFVSLQEMTRIVSNGFLSLKVNHKVYVKAHSVRF